MSRGFSRRILRVYRAEQDALADVCRYVGAAEAEARRAQVALHKAGTEPDYRGLARRLRSLGRQVARAQEALGIALGVREYIAEELGIGPSDQRKERPS